MSFFSLQFALFFFPLILAYFLVPRKYQWLCLLIGSYIFYLSSGISGLFFILLTTVTIFQAGKLLENRQLAMAERVKSCADAAEKKQEKALCLRDKKRIVSITIIINIAALAFSKYSESLLGGLSALLNVFGLQEPVFDLGLIKPLGISFYTLQAIGYLIEVYRGKTKAERNLLRFALYISYFPQVIQGPISKYQDLTATLYEPHDWDGQRVRSGALRVLWGFFKKLVIAERAGLAISHVLVNSNAQAHWAEGLIVFTGFIIYGFQIYADFSGGMDIVLGISEVFGIHVTENFNRPFCARSVAEFWQRWHMTLGAWMRNYVFYPLALSKPFNAMGRMLRKSCGAHIAKILPTSLASFIVFLLVGIWHGTGWKYAVYGLYQAIFVSTATLLEPLYAKCRTFFHIPTENSIWRLFQMARTLVIVTIGRYLSVAEDLGTALYLYKTTFTRDLHPLFFLNWERNLGLSIPDTLCLSIALSILFIVEYINERGIYVRRWVLKKPLVVRWTFYLLALYAIIIFGAYGQGYDASAFIYERF